MPQRFPFRLPFRLTVESLSITALVFAVLTIVALSVLAVRTTQKLINVNDRVLAMQRMISSLEAVRFNAVYLDSGEATFVITGDPSTLSPYLEAGIEMEREFASLSEKRDLLPSLASNYQKLGAAIARLQAIQKKIVEARRSDGFFAARDIVRGGTDQVAQESVTTLIAQMLNDARRVLKQLEADQLDFGQNVRNGVIALISASGVALLLLSLAVRKLNHQQKLAQDKITFAAMHDSLTGLPNRPAVIEHLDARLADPATERALGGFGLMLLDLDGFKAVNDSLGHDAGDELLVLVTARMAGALRETDYLARLGGDEFLIVIPQVSDRETAQRVADKLIAVIGRPYTLTHGTANVTASIGISLFPDHASDREALMKCADVAMYAAKSAGRNQSRFFAPAT
jgi:diguanylate cyclase (GGDEF)-like protein